MAEEKAVLSGEVVSVDYNLDTDKLSFLLTGDFGICKVQTKRGSSACEFLKRNLRRGDEIKIIATEIFKYPEGSLAMNEYLLQERGDIINYSLTLGKQQVDCEPLRTKEFTINGKIKNLRTYENIAMDIVTSDNRRYPVSASCLSDAAEYIKENFHDGDCVEVRAKFYRSATPPDSLNLFIGSKEDIIKQNPEE